MSEIQTQEPVTQSHGNKKLYCWPDNAMQCENDVEYSFWFTSPTGLCSSTGACEKHAYEYMISQFAHGHKVNTILVNVGKPNMVQWDLGEQAGNLQLIELTLDLAKMTLDRIKNKSV